jgi:hypothetical protein
MQRSRGAKSKEQNLPYQFFKRSPPTHDITAAQITTTLIIPILLKGMIKMKLGNTFALLAVLASSVEAENLRVRCFLLLSHRGRGCRRRGVAVAGRGVGNSRTDRFLP